MSSKKAESPTKVTSPQKSSEKNGKKLHERDDKDTENVEKEVLEQSTSKRQKTDSKITEQKSASKE